MSTDNIKHKISLYFTDAKSDKEYHAELVEVAPEAHAVNFRYGGRGKSLTCGTKTQIAVSYEKALTIYEKLVKEKTGKGYTEDMSGVPYYGMESAGEPIGFLPQLSNEISEDELERYLTDDNYCMQQKHDGERRELKVTSEDVFGGNRSGLKVAIPETIHEAAKFLGLSGDNEFDGEEVDGILHVFDLLKLNNENIRGRSQDERKIALELLMDEAAAKPGFTGGIQLVETYIGEKAKREAFARIRDSGKEGVIFKDRRATYEADRPNSLGPSIKYKFYETAVVYVTRKNDVRSVGIALNDNFGTVTNEPSMYDAGNVTIPEKKPVPDVGDLIEVRYLYCARIGGSLYQPTYNHPRKDVSAADDIASIKIKGQPKRMKLE